MLQQEILIVAQYLPEAVRFGRIHLGCATSTLLAPQLFESLPITIDDWVELEKQREFSADIDLDDIGARVSISLIRPNGYCVLGVCYSSGVLRLFEWFDNPRIEVRDQSLQTNCGLANKAWKHFHEWVEFGIDRLEIRKDGHPLTRIFAQWFHTC